MQILLDCVIDSLYVNIQAVARPNAIYARLAFCYQWALLFIVVSVPCSLLSISFT